MAAKSVVSVAAPRRRSVPFSLKKASEAAEPPPPTNRNNRNASVRPATILPLKLASGEPIRGSSAERVFPGI
jgi:hypothetical protein